MTYDQLVAKPREAPLAWNTAVDERLRGLHQEADRLDADRERDGVELEELEDDEEELEEDEEELEEDEEELEEDD
jgi:hypothetical protein